MDTNVVYNKHGVGIVELTSVPVAEQVALPDVLNDTTTYAVLSAADTDAFQLTLPSDVDIGNVVEIAIAPSAYHGVPGVFAAEGETVNGTTSVSFGGSAIIRKVSSSNWMLTSTN